MLLERREGYVNEKSEIKSFEWSVHTWSNSISHLSSFPEIKTKELFKSVKWKQQSSNVEVSWDPINLKEQTAFIKGYVMDCTDDTAKTSVSFSTGIVKLSFATAAKNDAPEGFTM